MSCRAVALAAALAGTAGAAMAFDWAIPGWLPPPPVPADNPMTPEKVELGRMLFYDGRLSADGTVACASCHAQDRAFTDGRALSVGVHGIVGDRNAPSLGNVGYMPTLTWDNPLIGSLEFHALIPLFGEDPEEMGNAGEEEALFARLMADPAYVRAFAAAFPDRPVADLFTLTRALGAFQRTLISARSPYDRFKYEGDRTALSAAALRGEALFFDHRLECYHCHLGFNFTNNLVTSRSAMPETVFHNTGLGVGGGLARFTGQARDAGRFRTPSLRNVAVTAPYMHDGRFRTLEEVIRHYAAGGEAARHGRPDPNRDPMIIGFRISEAEIADVIAFLESLTDEAFLTDPGLADPWPAGHPARATRTMPSPYDPETEGTHMTPRTAALALAATLALPAAQAAAHATFAEREVVQDETTRLTLRIPHGCGAEATLRVRVAIPEGVHSVQPMPKGGWDLDTVRGDLGATFTRFGREITEGVREIIWEGELRSDFYDEFVFRAVVSDAVPAGEILWVPVVQECATAAERWIEIPGPGQSAGDLRYPAPGLMVLPAADTGHGHSHSHDHGHSHDHDHGHSHGD